MVIDFEILNSPFVFDKLKPMFQLKEKCANLISMKMVTKHIMLGNMTSMPSVLSSPSLHRYKFLKAAYNISDLHHSMLKHKLNLEYLL